MSAMTINLSGDLVPVRYYHIEDNPDIDIREFVLLSDEEAMEPIAVFRHATMYGVPVLAMRMADGWSWTVSRTMPQSILSAIALLMAGCWAKITAHDDQIFVLQYTLSEKPYDPERRHS